LFSISLLLKIPSNVGVKEDLYQHLRIKCILTNGCVIHVVKVGEIQFVDNSTDDPCTVIRRTNSSRESGAEKVCP